MKIAVLIARILMGLLFTVVGFIKVVPVAPMQIPPGDAGSMMSLMMVHKWLMFYGLVETVSGLLLLSGRFVPLALTLLAGMITNITLFNATLMPSAVPMALVVGVLEVFLVYAYRSSFAGIFAAKAAPAV
jgi:putative oxidoreductase